CGAGPSSWSAAEPLSILEALQLLIADRVDVVFNALHGPGGEDGSFQGLLRHVGLPFTGPDVIPAAVTMDKRLAKAALRGAGIETPLSFDIPAAARGRAADWSSIAERHRGHMPLPWIAKPSRLGSSVGVAVFETVEEFLLWGRGLDSRRADPLADPAALDEHIVEEMVCGRELTCGVLETDGIAQPLPPVEIRPRGGGLFDYEAKYTPGASEETCPAPLPPPETARLQDLAVQVHRLFACDPLSRTDVFRLADGRFTVLEVNTLPGMTETSLIPLSARRCGIALEDLFDALVDHALRRAGRSSCAREAFVNAGKPR
ncbi:MAG: hypothetical protein JXA90_07200, partial [Planctomycetes bacterium]|nr:hypothetical protein [Planctomycetota bacterium]